jgi:hypothetical protein
MRIDEPSASGTGSRSRSTGFSSSSGALRGTRGCAASISGWPIAYPISISRVSRDTWPPSRHRTRPERVATRAGGTDASKAPRPVPTPSRAG